MTALITAKRISAANGIEKTGCYALLYAERGAATLCFEGKELCLKAGEVCLLAPTLTPRVQSTPDFAAVLLCIPATLSTVPVLSPLFTHFGDGARVVTLDGEKAAFFAPVMGDILQIPPETPFAAQVLLARAIDLLTALPVPPVQKENGARGRITAAVYAYIEQNISRAISLSDIAAALFVSKYHMSHVFRAENGISVGEAVLRRKVAHAEALLAAGVPAHRVSEMVGFHHYSAFFRIFKRITGHAPTGTR